jgi:hypothetical protein
MDKLEYVDQAVAGTAAKPFDVEQRGAFANINGADHAALQHGGKFYNAGRSHSHDHQA